MSSWTVRYISATPTREELVVPREEVADAVCPECGSDDVQRYPVACSFGARMATKCQACLHLLALERPTAEDNWPPFRSATYDWEASGSERASRRSIEGGAAR
jgi:predicted RNA-binding Zn-ribbon protein involved in translation (DUF1610 family)